MMHRFNTKALVALIALTTIMLSHAQTASQPKTTTVSADSFLESVSAHPVGDKAEREQGQLVGTDLAQAPRAEVERVLPSILQHANAANQVPVRGYAAMFLFMVAIRLDGGDLLASDDTEISSLLLDPEPGIQKVALAITDYVIGRNMTEHPKLLAALIAGIQNSQTPQDTAESIIGPLSFLGVRGNNDPRAVQAILAFLHRDDLSVNTRVAILDGLPNYYDTSEQISTYVCNYLDDPSPRVRAAAVIAFAHSAAQDAVIHSTSAFHRLAKDRIERMAKDSQENPQVRELAKQALAGQTNLNPNIDVSPDKQNPR